MKQNKATRNAALAALITGFLMLAGKMSAYLITNSAAIYSDALESVVHIFASGIAFISIIISSRPEDESHPYGHGNIEFFSAGFEGLLIIVAAIAIIYAAVHDLIFGSEIKKLDIGLYIVIAAGAVNLFLGWYLILTGKKYNSITLIADGKHVLTDSWTSLGVVVGIGLVMLTGYTILDPIFAIIVAANIIFTGSKLIRDSFNGLMDASDPEILKKLCDKIAEIKKDFWIDVHQLRVRRSGNKLFLDFHLVVPYFFTIQQTHTEEIEILKSVNELHHPSEIKIHLDHCDFSMCHFCAYAACPERKSEQNVFLTFDEKKIIGGPQQEHPDEEVTAIASKIK
ncbi:MAG: cation transporter [Ignavibacteriaceae bacterium]|nr:cation transporter [Ignavibacteriaceae bacterium]